MNRSLGRSAVVGTLWLGLVNLLSKGSQVLVTLALGIFLSASELGTVTVAIVVLNLGIVLQSTGVYDVIARTQDDPRRFAGTAATLSVATGALVAAVVALAAPEVGRLLGNRDAGDLLRVVVLGLPFTAYAGVQMGYLHRQLDFGRRLVPDAGSALAGAAVTVAGAAAGAGVWAVVSGVLTTAVLAPLLGALVGIRIRPRWSSGHAREIGRWAAVTGPGALVGVLVLNLDYVVVSRSLGEAATGVYSFAFRIAFVPYVMGAVVLGGVAFPIYARLMASGGTTAVGSALTRFVHVVVAATGGAYLAIALLADRIVLIDPRWEPSVPVLRVLCLYGLFFSLVLTGQEALRAVGRPGLYLRSQVAHLVLLAVGALALVRTGVVGVAWAQVGAAFVVVVAVFAMLARLGLVGRGSTSAVLRPLLAMAPVALAHEAAAAAGVLPSPSNLLGGVLVGLLVVAGYVASLLLLDRPLVTDLRSAVSRTAGDDDAGNDTVDRFLQPDQSLQGAPPSEGEPAR